MIIWKLRGAAGGDKSPGSGLLEESGEYFLFTEATEVLIEE